MIILLEGFDNAGKSTLAKRLADVTGFKLNHPGKKPKNIDEYLEMCTKQQSLFLSAKDQCLIMDRCTVISSKMYNQYDFLERVRTADYVKYLAFLSHIKIIYCRPARSILCDFSKHFESAADTSDSVKYAMTHCEEIIKRYDGLFEPLIHLRGHVFSFDYTSQESKLALNQFLGFEVFKQDSDVQSK